MIPFNIPCHVGTERDWVQAAIDRGHISGNGHFAALVQDALRERYGFGACLLTHSCTGALEIAAMLCDFQPGDEVILPSFTHVGTANAFARAGATLVFADSLPDHPNIDPASVAACIGPRTRALVVVHYAGVACDIGTLQAIAQAHGLLLVEDAAHAIGARYEGRALGTFGDFGAISFHETKNITCGQGGMLVVNDAAKVERARAIWENGTNRAAFFRGEVGQYTWVDMGGCFTLSELNAAYLHGQLGHLPEILSRRSGLWENYARALRPLAEAGCFGLPLVPEGRVANGHIFYLRLPDKAGRDALIAHLAAAGVMAVFHYIPLHSSPYFHGRHRGADLPQCQAWSDCIVRLPLYDCLAAHEQAHVIAAIEAFCAKRP
jgi:dTDP-4-amino-4,6-dideoxygalactose transaminase